MPRDKELLMTATKLVKEFACNTLYKLPASSFQKIAKDMLNHNRLGDGGWIVKSLISERKRIERARQNARKYGFSPFTNMGCYTFRWIKEQYAGWVLPLMAKKLEKPEDVYAVWAVQFADAMDALGKKACEEAEHLYQFVTTSKAWEEARPARQDYLEDFRNHKDKQKLKKIRRPSSSLASSPAFLPKPQRILPSRFRHSLL